MEPQRADGCRGGVRLWTVLLGSAIAVVFAAPVAAKGPAEGDLCGRSGCVPLRGYQATEPFTRWWSRPFTERPTPVPAAFFRIVLRQDAPDGHQPIKWTLLYVPQRSAMRILQSRVPPYAAGVGPYWRTVPPTARSALARATRGITPFRAPTAWR